MNSVFNQIQSTQENILARYLTQQQEFDWAKQISPPVFQGELPPRIATNITRTTSTIQVGRCNPTPDWIKINTDGASRGHPGMVGVGFICRDENVQTVMAFAQPLGLTTTITTGQKYWQPEL